MEEVFEDSFEKLDEECSSDDLEVLLTGLEFDSAGNLVARLRNLGAVYYPNWDHWFVTKMLGRNRDKAKAAEKRDKKYAEVVRKVSENEKLKEFEKKKKDKYWWTYAIKCPISIKDELPEEFIRGHYTPQARARLCSPGNFVTVDSHVAYALKRERQIENQLEFFRSRLSDKLSGNKLTIAENDINQIFESYTGKNWNETREKIINKKNLIRLDKEVLLARKEVADQINLTNQRLEGKVEISYLRRNKNSREYTLRTQQKIDKTQPDWKKKEKPWKYLANRRVPTAQELLDKKWALLDIEIPYFRREKPEITWVGITYVEKGIERKVIHTTHDIGTCDINGFEIISHKNENELIRGLTAEVKKENPDFVSAYNARFDLIKLRESEAGFPVGDEDTLPLFKVTTKFFERIGIKDRIVIDPLRWAKIARAYDINAKLEMTAGFEKEISYDDMEKLEEESLAGRQEAGKTIATYLSQDIVNLKRIVFSEEFKNNLDDGLDICEIFNLGLERLLHSPNCINEVQEKAYFSALGIYREEVPPHLRTKKMQQLKTSAREAFKKEAVIKPLEELTKGEGGLFENAYKVYVPYGDFFRDALAIRFPDIKKFLALKDSRKASKKRLFFLEQYNKELCRWISEDYGFFIKEVKKFDKIFKNNNEAEFERTYGEFKKYLAKNSHGGIKHFDEGTLTAASIEKQATPNLKQYLEKNNLSFEDFATFSNQRISVKRRWKNVIGNYSVAPSLRFSDSERRYENTMVLEEIMVDRIKTIKEFLATEGLKVVGHEGSYLYVSGNKEALLREEAPIVLVDDIPKLYVADNAYYNKFGFYSHLKLKEEPDFHSTVFEMKAYKQMLDNLMQGRNKEAIEAYEREMKRIKTGKVTNLELLFYNKSKERYSAFTPYSDRKDGRSYFITKEPLEGIKEDENGKYIEDEIKNETIRVNIKSIDEIELNYDKYIQRFKERGEAILAPVKKYAKVKKEKVNKNQMELSL